MGSETAYARDRRASSDETLAVANGEGGDEAMSEAIEPWQGYWTIHNTTRVENGRVIFGSFLRHYTRDRVLVEQTPHKDDGECNHVPGLPLI